MINFANLTQQNYDDLRSVKVDVWPPESTAHSAEGLAG